MNGSEYNERACSNCNRYINSRIRMNDTVMLSNMYTLMYVMFMVSTPMYPNSAIPVKTSGVVYPYKR